MADFPLDPGVTGQQSEAGLLHRADDAGRSGGRRPSLARAVGRAGRESTR